MIFAIAGSQGSGKSTVLAELRNRGYNIIDRKTARSILDDWNATLDQVNEDLNLKMKFQEELMLRKIKDDFEHINGDICFTERTFADLFGYTVINIGQYNECSEWMDDYYDSCLKAQTHYDATFYLTSGLFKVEDDGVRGINQHYSKVADMVFKSLTTKMSKYATVHEIDFKDLNDRVDFIEDVVVKLKAKNKG